MGIDGIGSSVVIALAAVLWFVYLVPTWLKRREYLATERNAVRLQQTMRIMAESAEVPDVIRVEASARSAAAQEKVLREQVRRDLAKEALRVKRVDSPSARRRLRRSRAFATFVLVGALVGAGFGVGALLASGSGMLLGGSIVVAIGAFALLAQAAAVTRARAKARRMPQVIPASTAVHDDADYAERAEKRRATWTPVPVPKPLYLSTPAPAVVASDASAPSPVRAVAHAAMPSAAVRADAVRAEALPAAEVDHEAELRAAAAAAERALRAAQAAPEVTRLPSRFAAMGVVDTADAAPADLDDILRRRRAVG